MRTMTIMRTLVITSSMVNTIRANMTIPLTNCIFEKWRSFFFIESGIKFEQCSEATLRQT